MYAQYRSTTQRHKPLLPTPRAECEDIAGIESSELLPDAVLPEQFYGSLRGAAHTRSQVALMRAVLDDAICCYQKQFIPSARRQQRLAREAEEWLFSDDDRWPFSFVNICHALGFDPEYLRQGLKRWRQRPQAKLQRRQRRIGPGRQMRLAA